MNDQSNTPAAKTAISYGDFSFDLTKGNFASVLALAQRGLTHVLGNEVASKVSAAKAKALEGTPAKGDTPAQPGVALTDDEVASLRAKFTAEKIAEIEAGTLGSGVNRGPTKDPLEAAIESITKASVLATLKANAIKPPKGDETIELAGGVTRTMAQMIATRYARDKAVIDKQAEKKVKEDAQRAAQAKDAAAALKAQGGTISAEALGL